MMPRLLLIIIVLIVAVSTTGCRNRNAPSSGKLQIIATIFPVYDFARSIGGDKVEVHLLVPPGVEPHNFEPKPEEVARISRAPLFIYTDKAMEPWAAGLVKGAGANGPQVVESGHGAKFLPATAHGHDDHHGEEGEAMDPHIWLDPDNARQMVENIATAMAGKDPTNAQLYMSNAQRLKGELAALDARFKAGLATCRQRTFLHGGHFAFAYLAKRYNLNYQSAYALSANAEPTPQRMAELIRELRSRHLNYIYYEELLSPAMAETIARETGAKLLKLHGLHTVGKADLARGVTYLSLMEENLKNLRIGLECP